MVSSLANGFSTVPIWQSCLPGMLVLSGGLEQCAPTVVSSLDREFFQSRTRLWMVEVEFERAVDNVRLDCRRGKVVVALLGHRRL
jgi:fructose-bisphosphate aldolase class 1